MEIIKLEFEGAFVIVPKVFEDYRGYYTESYSARTMKNELDFDKVFVQDNHSYTKKAGTIRGIHFQNNPKAQGKLVRCVKGRVMDFIVDLRKDSPTFKKWICVELNEENKKQLWIPEWCGHAFLTLSDDVEFLYKVTSFYEPELDRAIRWNDPEININWGIDNPIISEKDKNAPLLKDSDVNFSIGSNI